MADRTIVGDARQLTNTFKVDGTPTDPTTVTLEITDPTGNVATYTHPATVVRASAGVFYKDLPVDEDGVWEFKWTGTGAATDIATGTFTVWPADTDDIDVLTVVEAKQGLDIDQTNITKDAQLRGWITAVSQLLDEQCGPVRTRTETSTVYTTNPATVTVAGPIHSVTSVTSYTADTPTAVAASETSGYRLTPRTAGIGNYTGQIVRTGGTWGPRVVVVAVHGRHPHTEAVHPKFKQAAILIIKNLWRSEEISVGNVDGFDVPYPTFPATFALPNSVRGLLGEDWNGRRIEDHVGVMWG